MAADAALDIASSAAASALLPSGASQGDLGTVRGDDGVADLSHFGLVAVSGPEACQFLGSLFTGDVRLVSRSQGQFTSWCDGKGRMLATFWLFMHGDSYCLLLPEALVSATLARLKQFLFRTKASIRDASAELARIGLSGPGIAAALGTEAPAMGATFELEGCTLVALGSAPQPRWLAIGPAASMETLKAARLPDVAPVSSREWALLDILAGIPTLLPETSGEFIPQMVDLEALGGLSFNKGCYPGQEVVARLHYRGQLKRRMVLASVTADSVPAPGTKLYTPATSESVGMVLAAAPNGPATSALLAVIVIEHQERGDIRLGQADGPRLAFPAGTGPAVSASGC